MGVSKNVQNYKKSAIYQKPKTLKNYNFNPVFPLGKAIGKNPVFPVLELIEETTIFVQKWGEKYGFGQKSTFRFSWQGPW